VVFRIGSAAPVAGALSVEAHRLLFEGRSSSETVELSVDFDALREVRIGRRAGERLQGRAALLLERRDGPRIQVEPLGVGLLGELADLLTGLSGEGSGRSERVAVIVPLRPGKLAQATELVAQGPPFDPAALGLTHHEVYLGPKEATFVFDGPRARSTLERATRDPTLWQIGLRWRGCIGGRPRLAVPAGNVSGQLVYSWTAAHGPPSAP
jgi:hypothetical protein